jgi:hypothetical protein
VFTDVSGGVDPESPFRELDPLISRHPGVQENDAGEHLKDGEKP